MNYNEAMTYTPPDNPNRRAELTHSPGSFVPDDIPDEELTVDQKLARAQRDELVARQYAPGEERDPDAELEAQLDRLDNERAVTGQRPTRHPKHDPDSYGTG